MDPMDPMDAPHHATVVPMFPLQTVLLPTAVLPLQIFEPRYRQMIRTCLDGDRTFGVVLIERGREVGGGDERTDVGTVAQVVAATELPDGRWYVVAVGTHRLRVRRWLEDDPYPRAEVADWLDDPAVPDRRGRLRVAACPPPGGCWRWRRKQANRPARPPRSSPTTRRWAPSSWPPRCRSAPSTANGSS